MKGPDAPGEGAQSAKHPYGQAYLEYLARPRSPLRSAVRAFYMKELAALARGATLDIGCGVGELLRRLPPGSAGVEVNRDAVAFCRARGLDVSWISGGPEDFALGQVRPGRFQTVVLSHVLEHLDNPAGTLDVLLKAGPAKGVSRVVVAVPGRSGFHADPTHRVFVDEAYLQCHAGQLGSDSAWHLVRRGYFPVNCKRLADLSSWFELRLVYEARA